MKDFEEKNQKGKILILDDEEIVHLTLKKLLEQEGYQIESVYNGSQALTVVQNDFDLLISDIRMPGMGGIEVLQEIQNRKINIKVLMLTGFAGIDTATSALNYGACGYVMKPIENIIDFKAKIKEAITSSQIEKDNKFIFDVLYSDKKELLTNAAELPINLSLLEENNEAVGQFFHLLNQGIVIIDPDGKILFSNMYFAKMTSKHYQSLTGSLIKDIIGTSEKNNFENILNVLKQGKSVDNIEIVGIDNNDNITLRISALPIFKKDKYSGAILSILDESNIRTNNAKLELLAKLFEENTYDMMFVLCPSGEITTCNLLARNTFGFTLSEITGMNIKSLLVSQEDDSLENIFSCNILDTINSKNTWSSPCTAISKFKSEFPVHLSVSRSYNKASNDEFILCHMKLL